MNPDTGVAKSMPAAQWIPACAGMTTERAAGVTYSALLRLQKSAQCGRILGKIKEKNYA